MSREQLPITPSLITWARTRAGLTLEEASKKFSHIGRWERGESFPTYGQLEQLAERLKVPIAVFFFPEPPDVPPIQETFRTLPDVEFEHLPSRVQLLLRKAKALQLNLSELTQSKNPAPRLITQDLSFSPNVSVVQMASDVRTYLKVPLDRQTAWPSDDVALKEWRGVLLEVGVFVFKDAFRIEDFSGFCLDDPLFPIIYVNNSSTKTRQIFTLFHELAHLIFHTSGVDSVNDDYISRLRGESKSIEVLCNRFAAQFLLPDHALDRAIKGRQPSEATAEELAALFHVSRESVFRRFLDRGLISNDRYHKAVALWSGQRQAGGEGGDYYWTKLSYLGREYVELALGQFHKNRIDEVQLAEYLDTKPRNLGGIEEYFERGTV